MGCGRDLHEQRAASVACRVTRISESETITHTLLCLYLCCIYTLYHIHRPREYSVHPRLSRTVAAQCPLSGLSVSLSRDTARLCVVTATRRERHCDSSDETMLSLTTHRTTYRTPYTRRFTSFAPWKRQRNSSRLLPNFLTLRGTRQRWGNTTLQHTHTKKPHSARTASQQHSRPRTRTRATARHVTRLSTRLHNNKRHASCGHNNSTTADSTASSTSATLTTAGIRDTVCTGCVRAAFVPRHPPLPQRRDRPPCHNAFLYASMHRTAIIGAA